MLLSGRNSGYFYRILFLTRDQSMNYCLWPFCDWLLQFVLLFGQCFMANFAVLNCLHASDSDTIMTPFRDTPLLCRYRYTLSNLHGAPTWHQGIETLPQRFYSSCSGMKLRNYYWKSHQLALPSINCIFRGLRHTLIFWNILIKKKNKNKNKKTQQKTDKDLFS